MKQQAIYKAKAIVEQHPATSLLTSPRFHLGVIATLALLVYLPSLSYQLTYYDDATLIENMRQFIAGKNSFYQIFSQSVFGSPVNGGDYFYRPLLTLSFYLNALAGGESLKGFYFINILLHIAACWLLYAFLLKMKFDSQLALIAAAIFTLHPALVQAVAWIPGRNDSLLTVFALGSLLFLIKFLEEGKTFSLLLHLLFFFLSLLTKETAVLLPVLYFIVWRISGTNNTVIETEQQTRVGLPAIIISWILLTVVFFLVRRAVLGSSVGLPLSFTVENFFNNLPALLQYIGKMLLPFNLSTFPILKDTSYLFGIITVAALSYFLITSKKRRENYVLLGSCWLFLFLFPAILRTSSDYESVFLEHRLYFPLIGFMLLWVETDLVKKFKWESDISKIISGFIILLFAFLTYTNSKNYKDEFSYWSKAVASSPNASFAHRGLGTSYLTSGKNAEAEKEYQTALQLNPDLKEVRNNLGRIYLNTGQTEKAEKLFNDELSINPDNAVAWYNLALLRLDQKNIPQAETLIRKSLSIDPSYLDAQNDLCVVLAMQKKYDEATQLCIRILDDHPSYESAKKNLSLIFNSWNDSGKVDYYRKVLAQKGIVI
ncbi:MAG TPA: tetratricopeptide repeat protein [Chitinophagales bacterium]|nr:tetratricopeptide repeat protein [Chitinophagales bacterium]